MMYRRVNAHSESVENGLQGSGRQLVRQDVAWIRKGSEAPRLPVVIVVLLKE